MLDEGRCNMAKLCNCMESEIRREITKLYKSSFGKGPESTEVIIYENFVFLKFLGAFSQIEETLLKTVKGREIVEEIRDELILAQASIYIPIIEEIVKEKVDKVNYIMEEKKNTLYMFILFTNIIEKV